MSATLSNVFKLPFQEQIAFFRQKVNLPTKRYDDIKKTTHDRAFVVAGAQSADLLNDLRKTIDQCISEGKSIGWYRKNWEAIVAKHGWTDYTGHESQARRVWRTRVTYQTNMSVSYAAGRWEQLHDPDLVMMPYLKYVHGDARHPRQHHLAWHNFTAPRDHPFWATHAVPNGWMCHCSIVGARDEDYAKAKADGKHEPPAGWDKVDPKTGEQVGIDKGFGYAPGESVKRHLQNFVAQKLTNLSPEIAKSLESHVNPVLGSITPIQQAAPYWDASTRAGKWHEASFSDAPTYIKDIVRRVGDIKVLSSPKEPPYCQPDKFIEMDGVKKDRTRSQSVWRHEFGHYVDGALAKDNLKLLSQHVGFVDAMKKDAAALIKDGAHGLQTANTTLTRRAWLDKRYALSSESFGVAADKATWLSARAKEVGIDYAEMQAQMQKHAVFTDLPLNAKQERYRRIIEAWGQKDAQGLMDAMTGGYGSDESYRVFEKGVVGNVSDLFGSVTRNKVAGQDKSGFGHSDKYYRQWSANQGAESFANLYDLHGEGSPFWTQLAERFVPNVNNVFLELLK
jgi:hypothetical protein